MTAPRSCSVSPAGRVGRGEVGTWRGEDGAVSMLVVGLALALLLVAGLVFDGGRLLAARSEAFAVADNAARAGAQAVDIAELRASGTAAFDRAAAETAALAFLDRAGHRGSVNVSPQQVEVTVTITAETAILGLAGVDERTVTATGRATLVSGVSAGEG